MFRIHITFRSKVQSDYDGEIHVKNYNAKTPSLHEIPITICYNTAHPHIIAIPDSESIRLKE